MILRRRAKIANEWVWTNHHGDNEVVSALWINRVWTNHHGDNEVVSALWINRVWTNHHGDNEVVSAFERLLVALTRRLLPPRACSTNSRRVSKASLCEHEHLPLYGIRCLA